MASTFLAVRNVTKRFPGVVAVNDVSLQIAQGEILALVGENGAGKSTLSQRLAGAIRPDTGTIELDGEVVSFSSPLDAIHAGITIVFQELSLIGSLSIAENIFANRQPVGVLNRIQWRTLYEETAGFLHMIYRSGRYRTSPSHSPGSLHSASSRMSSIATPRGRSRLT